MTDTDITARLLEAARMHVPFDGWSETTFRTAARDAGISEGVARAAVPRGAVGLALAHHEAGDAAMLDRLTKTDLSAMRFRDRISFAVRARLEAVDDKELVRRASTLFTLPQHSGLAARAAWGTADRIWTALGDTSDDVNWYTKRATLAGVYSATVLYWLGDDSDGHSRTWDFLDRRIEDVMQIEKLKARVRDNRMLSSLMQGPLTVLGRIKAPRAARADDMPGQWRRDAPDAPDAKGA